MTRPSGRPVSVSVAPSDLRTPSLQVQREINTGGGRRGVPSPSRISLWRSPHLSHCHCQRLALPVPGHVPAVKVKQGPAPAWARAGPTWGVGGGSSPGSRRFHQRLPP